MLNLALSLFPNVNTMNHCYKKDSFLFNISLLLTFKTVTHTINISGPIIDTMIESESNMYSCSQCSSKFKQRLKPTRHIKYVHTRDEFQCDKCTSSFGRRDNLEKH